MSCSWVFGSVLFQFAACLATDPAWIESLKHDGYLVREGIFGYFDTVTCAKADTCYAINPVTPYGLIYLPAHPNETDKGNYTNTCHIHRLCKQIGGVTYTPNWRVAPGEVIILMGRTPPESTYWSFAPSIYSRHFESGFKPHPSDISRRISACPSVPKGSAGNRCEVFSAVNDPLNFQTVKVSSPTPFNASFAMMLSWDAEVESDVAKELQKYAVDSVNVLRYPGAISKLGVTEGNEDEFINVMRVEQIKHKADADAFYGGGSHTYKVYRISRPLGNPPAPGSYHASFDGHMRTRWTGRSESGTNASFEQLRDGVKQLKDIIIDKNARHWDYNVQEFKSFVNDSGYECLAEGLKCQGDCRDTIYAKATMLIEETICNMTHIPCKPSRRAELTQKKSDSFFVIGVNHKMTGQSLYSSITTYNYPKLAAGILSPPNGEPSYTMMDKDYQGSATKLLPNHPSAPYLYVVKFARHCSANDEVLCVEVPAHVDDPNVTAITEDQPFVFIERMYIHPGTASGPAVAETVLPVLIHFNDRLTSEVLV